MLTDVFKQKKTAHILILSFILLTVTSCSYQADFDIEELLLAAPGVTLENHNTTIIVNPPEESQTALIFYPGGSVDYSAYLPLMIKCASNGIKCFLPQMPYDLAILDISEAEKYLIDYPEIKNWYLGGHSLGGAMASKHISSCFSDYKGLILLAAYSTEDISETGLNVLCIYGSNDGVMNMDNYKKNKSNLPNDYTEYIIEGGNHGNFGSYGKQSGDNEADISREEQQSITADYIGDFVK